MRTIAVVLAAASAASAHPAPADPMGAVRLVDVRYGAHDGYAHTAEMHWNRRLPFALRQLGLLPRLDAV